MGNWLCKNRKIRVMFLGLEYVGKTSLLYHLKLGEVVSTIPTIGYNTEIVDIDGIEVTLWDVTSRGKSRALWHHYFAGTDAYVFVIDSCDKQFFGEGMEEFFRVCYDDQTRDTMFMVVANKQDLDGAMSAQEIEDKLIERHFHRQQGHTIFVVPCNALDVKQVNQIFTRFTHYICLNQAGKLKRGLITMKEQSQMEEANKESILKSLLKSPTEFLKSLF